MRRLVTFVAAVLIGCASTPVRVVSQTDVPRPDTRVLAPEALGPLDDHRILARVERVDPTAEGVSLAVTLTEECPYVEQVQRTERTRAGGDDVTTGLWIGSGALAAGGIVAFVVAGSAGQPTSEWEGDAYLGRTMGGIVMGSVLVGSAVILAVVALVRGAGAGDEERTFETRRSAGFGPCAARDERTVSFRSGPAVDALTPGLTARFTGSTTIVLQVTLASAGDDGPRRAMVLARALPLVTWQVPEGDAVRVVEGVLVVEPRP